MKKYVQIVIVLAFAVILYLNVSAKSVGDATEAEASASVRGVTPAQTESAGRDSVLAHISGCPEAKAIVVLEAKGDGVTDCLPAVNDAIGKAKAIIENEGAARILIPAGVYMLNGPIHLISGLTLEIAEGATLRFSGDASHYLPVVDTSWEGSYCKNYSPFIYGHNLQNVAIVGTGTIDGNAAETFATWRAKQGEGSRILRDHNHNQVAVNERIMGENYFLRPQLIQLYECDNVTIDGVKIVNAPFWCVHLLKCNNVICRGLRYDAKLVNNDGIDVESSHNVLIEKVLFNNGDDNIAIKSGRDHDGRVSACPSEDIVIRGCSFKGLHAVVIGSEMSGGVRNVWIENCSFAGYCKRGLYAKTNPDRGAFIHDIYMSDCRFGEVENLVYVTCMYAGEGLDSGYYTDIHDIHVKNVNCRRANKSAIVLQGTAAKPLRNITFENVNVEWAQNGIQMTNTGTLGIKDCKFGDESFEVPSMVSEKDDIFRL